MFFAKIFAVLHRRQEGKKNTFHLGSIVISSLCLRGHLRYNAPGTLMQNLHFAIEKNARRNVINGNKVKKVPRVCACFLGGVGVALEMGL